jgi:ABC-2 type transport system ATP-binding protein
VARGLVKRFGARRVLDGIDLDLRPGEVFGLLGPNGAGKTTLMHLLAGASARDAGTIELLGAGDPRTAAVRRHIGLAPQGIALYPDLSAEENLRFFGRVHGLRGARLASRVEAALALASLDSRRRDHVGAFSGGMQRRLNLACATLHEPEILLLDEPTAGVDPQSRTHLFDAIVALARGGRTVVVSTHHLDEAERICDRIAVLDAGRIRAFESVQGLVEGHGLGHSLERAFLSLTGAELRDS